VVTYKNKVGSSEELIGAESIELLSNALLTIKGDNADDSKWGRQITVTGGSATLHNTVYIKNDGSNHTEKIILSSSPVVVTVKANAGTIVVAASTVSTIEELHTIIPGTSGSKIVCEPNSGGVIVGSTSLVTAGSTALWNGGGSWSIQ
jgi:hypothetical protein